MRANLFGLQLGFAYADSPGVVVASSDPPDDPSAPTAPLTQEVDPVRHYVPTTRPGGRLPHAWVQTADGTRVSTLDLVPAAGALLLTASPAWATAAEAAIADGRLGAPLTVVLVGRDVDDVTGHWTKVAGLGDEGAVLVRPDQHVLWRSLRCADDLDDPTAELLAALHVLAGRPAVPAT